MSNFKPGDLLICVNNTNYENVPVTLPVIDNYYTWRGDVEGCTCGQHGYVEEITSPLDPLFNEEWAQLAIWYRKVDVDIDINELVKECQLQEVN